MIVPQPFGFGCMRLAEDDDAAIATLTAALDAGVTLLDTAGAYGREPHHNERLVARAMATRAVTVVTKGGMRREGTRWIPDGRATALRSDCDSSRDALGVDVLDAFLLHAPDPRAKLGTSVRALAALREAGLVRAIGVCNVSLRELDEALAIAPLELVEVACSPFDDTAIRGGVIGRCIERGIRVLLHSPLGGPKRAAKLAREEALAAVARKHGATPQQIAIAWLRDLDPALVPIPSTRDPGRARSFAVAIELDDEDRAALDARQPSVRRIRVRDEAPIAAGEGDVRLIMGVPGAGKSFLATSWVGRGYVRLNRDDRGGTLRELAAALDEALGGGARQVVLDNTYVTRAQRAEVLNVARRHGVAVRCTHVDAPIEIAQGNAARRMIDAFGRLLDLPEIEKRSRTDPRALAPTALFRVRRALEPPSLDEGFVEIETRQATPAPKAGERAALFVAHDRLQMADLTSLAASYDVRVAFGWLPEGAPAPPLPAGFESTTCPHPAGPPTCWCRPPLPGLLVRAIVQHTIDPARSLVLGATPGHAAMARAIGAPYRDH